MRIYLWNNAVLMLWFCIGYDFYVVSNSKAKNFGGLFSIYYL
ncbi:hypothetical protein NLO413_0622 [Candidatus Neoehrlichia lotoris str. RAC413]|uniref:Uncharacterized protein n=1 Tax=Candidatus Neoehrlichia procyonis str. RAC413 TaxID=1359163 RepID=A0A0F3NMH3_9RICK|nr:hypothetical protein NLO413_0622 [Candidatus Neoehrlichia lotoris str. RAC413]